MHVVAVVPRQNRAHRCESKHAAVAHTRAHRCESKHTAVARKEVHGIACKAGVHTTSHGRSCFKELSAAETYPTICMSPVECYMNP